jgi:excisionase family DNA binding protein
MQTHTPSTHTHPSPSSGPWRDQDRAGAGATAPGGPGRLLGAEEVALLLGVPRTFVYALARRGELPTVRIGERYVRFRAPALEAWIAAQESSRPRGTQ